MSVPSPDVNAQPTSARAPAMLRLLRWTVGTAAVMVLLWLLGSVMLMVFAAALLAVALRGGADWLSRHTGWSPRLCLLLVSVLIVLLISAAALLSGPRLAEQGNQLWDQLILAFDAVRNWLQQYSWGRSIIAGTSAEGIAQDGQRLASRLGIALVTIMGALASLVIVIVTALYFAVAPRLYVTGLIRLLPKHRRRRGREFLSAAAETLRHWLMGQGIAMLLIAIATYAGLALIGVPLAPLLALIAGITNFVPYVGPIVGALPALLVALGESLHTTLSVAVLFAGVQFLEGNVVEPIVQKRMTRLPPALTILSQTVLGSLFGVIGVILATPALAVILLGVRMLYVEDVLGDRSRAARRSFR